MPNKSAGGCTEHYDDAQTQNTDLDHAGATGGLPSGGRHTGRLAPRPADMVRGHRGTLRMGRDDGVPVRPELGVPAAGDVCTLPDQRAGAGGAGRGRSLRLRRERVGLSTKPTHKDPAGPRPLRSYRATFEHPDTGRQVTSVDFRALDDDDAWKKAWCDGDELSKKHSCELIVKLAEITENYKN